MIAHRWGRLATVLPHPHVVDEPTLSTTREERSDFVVGVHLKSMRASMDPQPVVATLAKVVPELPGARLRVDVHTDVMTAGMPRHDPEISRSLRALEATGRIELAVHDFFSDDELLGILPRSRPLRPSLQVRHSLWMARGLLRPRHNGAGFGLRFLQPAASVPELHSGAQRTTDTPRELRFVSFGMCQTSFGFDGSAMSRTDVPLNSILPVIGFISGLPSRKLSW